jgi:MoaA/NifB/PqqE/SkfB family radical SAM enzyme
MGFSKMTIASVDDFHEQQGLPTRIFRDTGLFEGMLESLSWQGVHMQYQYQGSGEVAPLGRGRHVRKELRKQASSCLVGQDWITIDPWGDVYMCCWKRPYASGNVLDEPLIDIFTRAKEDDLIQRLGDGDAAYIAHNAGVITEDEIDRYINNPCDICIPMFRDVESLL